MIIPIIILIVNVLSIQGNDHQSIKGSLDGLWEFNFTLYLERFENRILDCYDFENNSLIINVTKSEESSRNLITFKFNTVSQNIYLDSLCKCDPCDETMVTFDVKATKENVKITCNDFGYFTIDRSNIKQNKLEWLQRILIKPNRLYISIATNRKGCLDTFSNQNGEITFRKLESLFMEKCPRKCNRNICHKGKCRALDTNGPTCDCSTAALDGLYCDKELRRYKKEYINSYLKTEATKHVHFKLSWNSNATKMLCLIEFVSAYEHETLYIHSTRLMNGKSKISDIEEKGTNFLTVIQMENDVIMKVNGKDIQYKPDIIGELQINIGFTTTNQRCDTFEGLYDFKSDSSQLHSVLHGNNIQTHTVSIFSNMYVLGLAVISLVLLLLVIVILPLLCYYGNQKKKMKTKYDSHIKQKNDVLIELNDPLYDMPNKSQMYYKKHNFNVYELPNQNENGTSVPILPERNI